jgi:hypothetical protein
MPLLSKTASIILSQSMDRFETVPCRSATRLYDLGARLPRLFHRYKRCTSLIHNNARMLLCASKAFVASTSAASVAKLVLDLKNKPSLKLPALKRR